MKVTRESLMARIRRIVKITKTPITLHSQTGMPGRMYQIQDENKGGRNVSSMLSGKEMEAYLDGYEAALSHLQFFAEDERRHRLNNKNWSKDDKMDCVAPVIGCLFCPCPDCMQTTKDREMSRKKTMKGWAEL